MAHKLSKAKNATGRGIYAIASGARQLGHSSSGGDFDGQEGNKVSYYAGLGPTGTAQDVSYQYYNPQTLNPVALDSDFSACSVIYRQEMKTQLLYC